MRFIGLVPLKSKDADENDRSNARRWRSSYRDCKHGFLWDATVITGDYHLVKVSKVRDQSRVNNTVARSQRKVNWSMLLCENICASSC